MSRITSVLGKSLHVYEDSVTRPTDVPFKEMPISIEVKVTSRDTPEAVIAGAIVRFRMYLRRKIG